MGRGVISTSQDNVGGQVSDSSDKDGGCNIQTNVGSKQVSRFVAGKLEEDKGAYSGNADLNVGAGFNAGADTYKRLGSADTSIGNTNASKILVSVDNSCKTDVKAARCFAGKQAESNMQSDVNSLSNN
eukprot:9646266-Karenia_brevis.AAC.1